MPPIIHTCFAAVNAETVFLTDEALGQARALGHNLAGIWLGGSTLLRAADGTGHRVNRDGRGFMQAVAGHKLGTWKTEERVLRKVHPGAIHIQFLFIFSSLITLTFCFPENQRPYQWFWPWRGFPRCGKDRRIWWKLDSCQEPLGYMWLCSPRDTPHSPSSPWRVRQWSQLKRQGLRCSCLPQIHMHFLEGIEYGELWWWGR